MPVAFKEPSIQEQREMASAAAMPSAVRNSMSGLAVEQGGGNNGAVRMQPFRPQFADGKDPGAEAGRATDPEFNLHLASVRQRLSLTGVVPATVVSFLPIPVVLNTPMTDLARVRIPPCTGDLQFTSYTFVEPAIEVQHRQELKLPLDYQPIQLAKAFEVEYMQQGGVVAIFGLPTPENMATAENAAKIQDAKDRMIPWLVGKVEEANGYWNSAGHQDSKYIVDTHRACARRLNDLGLIEELPAWIQPLKQTPRAELKCGNCGTQAEPGAAQCIKCYHIIDPAAALKNGLIEEDHISLERLTREEVTKLGISDYVAETSDEKPKRREKGLPKPMSAVMKRQQQAAQAAE